MIRGYYAELGGTDLAALRKRPGLQLSVKRLGWMSGKRFAMSCHEAGMTTMSGNKQRSNMERG